MSKIHKILFPTDFSETAQNAFRYCIRLADQYGAEIIVLHAVYPEYEMLDLPVLASKATQDKTDAARDALASFIGLGLGQVQSDGGLQQSPNMTSVVEVGAPVGIIRKMQKKFGAGLIVMGTKGEHNALEKSLGSITTGVVEGVHCPVMVIPESAPWKAPHVVAYATDLSESDPYHVWQATEMLEPFHPLLHVVHIANGKSTAGHLTDLSEVEAFFRQTPHITPALNITFHELERSSVTGGLEEFTDYYQVDLLVMFAPHHTWLDRLIRPSATRKMAMEAPVPLLLLKNQEPA